MLKGRVGLEATQAHNAWPKSNMSGGRYHGSCGRKLLPCNDLPPI
jgi:hypothetical protein